MKTKFRVGKPKECTLEKSEDQLIDRVILLFTEMAANPQKWPRAYKAVEAAKEARSETPFPAPK